MVSFYVPQFHGAACSVASVTQILNAALSERGKKTGLSADDRWLEQPALLEKVKVESWKERVLGGNLLKTGLSRGVTLDQLAQISEAAFKDAGFTKAQATVHRFDGDLPAAKAALLRLLQENEQSTRDFLLANFDQKRFTDDAEVGHISPIGAFDAQSSGKVLIFDTDHEYYEPYWVSVETLLEGLRTTDSVSGKTRGLVRLQVSPH
jgi:hypothetical protein